MNVSLNKHLQPSEIDIPGKVLFKREGSDDGRNYLKLAIVNNKLITNWKSRYEKATQISLTFDNPMTQGTLRIGDRINLKFNDGTFDRLLIPAELSLCGGKRLSWIRPDQPNVNTLWTVWDFLGK